MVRHIFTADPTAHVFGGRLYIYTSHDNATDGRWYVVYHAYEKSNLNRGCQMLMEPVTLTADGWLSAPTGSNVDKPIVCPLPDSCGTYRYADALRLFRTGLEGKGAAITTRSILRVSAARSRQRAIGLWESVAVAADTATAARCGLR